MDEAHEIGLAIDGDGERGRMWEARIRAYGEQCRRAGAEAMRAFADSNRVMDIALKYSNSPTECIALGNEIKALMLEASGSLPSAAEVASPAAGWRLVPVEPTAAMVEAHFAAHAKAKNVFADVPDIWAAMLEAAPSPSEEARAG